MDRSVPSAAAKLLNFIRKTEVGTEARSGYDVIYGQNQDKLAKPVTKMTITEIMKAQGGWSKRFGSSATAGYQFMKATLADLVKELSLDTGMLFTADLQDRLGFHLLKRRGYDDFMAGKIGRIEFAKRLADMPVRVVRSAVAAVDVAVIIRVARAARVVCASSMDRTALILRQTRETCNGRSGVD